MSPECTICMENFDREGDLCPKLLPCSHTICLKCLRQLVVGHGRRIQCPECRVCHVIPNEADCATNRYIIDMIEFTEQIKELEETERRVQIEIVEIKKQAEHDTTEMMAQAINRIEELETINAQLKTENLHKEHIAFDATHLMVHTMDLETEHKQIREDNLHREDLDPELFGNELVRFLAIVLLIGVLRESIDSARFGNDFISSLDIIIMILAIRGEIVMPLVIDFRLGLGQFYFQAIYFSIQHLTQRINCIFEFLFTEWENVSRDD